MGGGDRDVIVISASVTYVTGRKKQIDHLKEKIITSFCAFSRMIAFSSSKQLLILARRRRSSKGLIT